MGDTFGAWVVTMPTGVKHVIVDKAYAAAIGVARRRYPGYTAIDLVNSKHGQGGEVVVIEDDGKERVG